MTQANIIQIIVILICVIFSAYFSATETAFLSFNKIRMKNLASDGDKRAALVMRLSDNYDSLLSTILIGNNIVNITLASVATVMFTGWFPNNGAVISTAVTTVIVLIFGEISPKSISKETPDSFAKFSAPFINALMLLFTPLNFIFKNWKKLLAKIFKFGGTTAITEEELKTIVDEAEHDGGINEREGDLIRSAIEFDDAEAADIITPRVDVVAIELTDTNDEIADIFHKTGFSRLPVYDETIDNIIGVLHEKDFFYQVKSGNKKISDVLGKALYVPCHVKISKLLAQFQKAKAHMAIVLDDYGGTMGIATLEDVIEELVGDIYDEHDEVVELFTKNPDGSVTVNGNARTDDLFDYFDMEYDDDDDMPQTVNGWVTQTMGSFPAPGASFDYKTLHVEVTETGDKMVEKVKVTVTEPEEEEDAPQQNLAGKIADKLAGKHSSDDNDTDED